MVSYSVYQILYKNEVVYIGKTAKPKARFKTHIRDIKAVESCSNPQQIHRFSYEKIVMDGEINIRFHIMKENIKTDDAAVYYERLAILNAIRNKGLDLQNNCGWSHLCRGKMCREELLERIKDDVGLDLLMSVSYSKTEEERERQELNIKLKKVFPDCMPRKKQGRIACNI